MTPEIFQRLGARVCVCVCVCVLVFDIPSNIVQLQLLLVSCFMVFLFFYQYIYIFFLLAFSPANWSVFIDNTTTTGIRFSWPNLQTLVRKQVSHYFTVIKNSYGNSVSGYIVPGNTTSHVFSGLTAYREYRLSVFGVNYSGNTYNSTEITAWTDEGGTCII